MDKENTSHEDPVFQEYVAGQKEEILSPFNQWVTGKKLGRPPNPDDCALHYTLHGGAKAYAQKNDRDIEGADL
ncbi:MAG: hypothetical protein UY42_C0009G0047 [Parcubacteria group bacterium GW2011_GWA2_49_16]|nr:MAG: hypothetical protein UY42_C0009G0047 [Parcubacteria group bacterium GW2011_GWA2_49_16]